jgi:ABC-type glucose/galactose transport system permease subunit
VTRFSYTWNAGTSAVTGKAIALTSVRYYIAKDATTLAVITYGVASNQFDPQGADDIASTFQWQ